MEICKKCNKTLQNGEKKELCGQALCEDCYIDTVMPKMPKAHYDNAAEFMNRLQESYSVRKQRFH
jgi:hypothetical protein